MFNIPKDKMLQSDYLAIVNFFNVPSKDSADNITMADVIGNKTDGHEGDSLYALTETLNDHVHSVSMVWPSLADSIVLTADAADWALGAAVDIVEANDIASDFDIHEIMIEDASTLNKSYEVHLFRKDNDVLLGKIKFRVTSNVSTPTAGSFQTVIIPKNTGVYGKLAIEDGNGSSTVLLSIRYHIY